MRLMSESDEAQVGCVSTEAETTCKAVGPSMFLDVSVEGVSLPALVDCGAQSTIISRELLHRVARQRLREEKEILKLEKPTVRLFWEGWTPRWTRADYHRSSGTHHRGLW